MVSILALLALATIHPPQPTSESYVVLISIDGFAAERLEDEELELPHLRAMARGGAWAESSQTVFLSTDHPAHTSIVTGVEPRIHGVLGNRMLNRETGEYYQVTNKPHTESVKAPTIFDAAKRRGYRTASLFWPENREDPSLDYSIPLVLTGDARADMSASDPEFLQELRDNDVLIDFFFEWYNDLPLQTTSDRVLARAAAYVIEAYKPQLLAIHFPAMDRYQHQYGPDHYLTKAAATAADYNVGLLRRAIERAGIANDTTVFVVSDHGFHTVEHSVNVYPLFARAGLLEEVAFHAFYLSVMVELTDRFDADKHLQALESVFGQVAELNGISRVIRPYEFAQYGLPSYEENPHVLGHYIILGDQDTRVVTDESGESTRRTTLSAPLHGHGYLPDDPHMDPVFLMAGRGVRSGIRLDRVHILDIAPTVAHLLGLDMSDLGGRILTEALVDN